MPVPSESVVDPSEAQVLFVDLQDEALASKLTNPAELIRGSAGALARVAKIYELPTVQTAIDLGILQTDAQPEEGTPHSIREITAEIGDEAVIRSNPHSLAQPAIRDALERNQRRVLAIGGLVTEVGLLNAVLGAVGAGYEVHVMVDVAGGLTERTEQAAFRRMEQAGAFLSSVMTFAAAMLQDFSSPENAQLADALRASGPFRAAGLGAERPR